MTASIDFTARVWDADTGKEVGRWSGHTGFGFTAAHSGDGRRVVSTPDDGVVRVWDAGTDKLRLTLAGHDRQVKAAAFSPDGGRILTAGRDGGDDRAVRLIVYDTRPARETFVRTPGRPRPRAAGRGRR